MEIIEQHLDIIKKEKSQVMAIDAGKAAMFKGDFYGMLRALGVAPAYWFATLRASGMISPTEFDVSFETIIMPDDEYLRSLRRQYETLLRL